MPDYADTETWKPWQRDHQESAPSGSFLCDRLEIMVPDENFRFHARRTFLLGTRP